MFKQNVWMLNILKHQVWNIITKHENYFTSPVYGEIKKILLSQIFEFGEGETFT